MCVGFPYTSGRDGGSTQDDVRMGGKMAVDSRVDDLFMDAFELS